MKQVRLQEIIDFAHESKRVGISGADELIEMTDAYINALGDFLGFCQWIVNTNPTQPVIIEVARQIKEKYSDV